MFNQVREREIQLGDVIIYGCTDTCRAACIFLLGMLDDAEVHSTSADILTQGGELFLLDALRYGVCLDPVITRKVGLKIWDDAITDFKAKPLTLCERALTGHKGTDLLGKLLKCSRYPGIGALLPELLADAEAPLLMRQDAVRHFRSALKFTAGELRTLGDQLDAETWRQVNDLDIVWQRNQRIMRLMVQAQPKIYHFLEPLLQEPT
jgi:hypothetical protein